MTDIFTEGEVIVGAWSRRVVRSTGTTDGYIKLYCDEDMIDAFAALSDDDCRGEKKHGGKMFYVKFMSIDQEPQEPKIRPSNLAAIIGDDTVFPTFVIETYPEELAIFRKTKEWQSIDPYDIKEKSAAFIRFYCSVDSRAKLDTNEEAQLLFIENLYIPFQNFKKMPKGDMPC